LRALLNIKPSYKILICPIMATLKAETCNCFRFSVSNKIYAVLTDAYRLLTTSVPYPSSAVAAASSISILASHLRLKLPGLFFQLPETKFCANLSFIYECDNSHICLQPCSDFLNKFLVNATKKGPSAGFSQQSLEFLWFPLTVSISPLLCTHLNPPLVLRDTWQQGTNYVLGFSLSEAAFRWSKCRELLYFQIWNLN
jgi:hypothetical protein